MDVLYPESLPMKKAVALDKLECTVVYIREKPIMGVCRMSVKEEEGKRIRNQMSVSSLGGINTLSKNNGRYRNRLLYLSLYRVIQKDVYTLQK
jgi:hypothetical protein